MILQDPPHDSLPFFLPFFGLLGSLTWKVLPWPGLLVQVLTAGAGQEGSGGSREAPCSASASGWGGCVEVEEGVTEALPARVGPAERLPRASMDDPLSPRSHHPHMTPLCTGAI